jgi:hypothetical protein
MLRLHEYRYHRPERLSDALALLEREDAMPIAGGTDLMPNMKHRLFSPNHLVALKGIRERCVAWWRVTEMAGGALDRGGGDAFRRSPLTRWSGEHFASLADGGGCRCRDRRSGTRAR